MSRTLIKCHACRYRILDTFASLSGLTIRSLPPSERSINIHRPLLPSQQAFSTSRLYSNTPRVDPEQLAKNPETENESIPEPEINTSSSSSGSLPWYLQVSKPTPPTPIHSSPHLALQEIPPIPSDAPTILLPILEHLSDSIGLDNLTLLDLRGLDPPPALGANLLMVLGTARSYKHLNTSADRFCRWMRATYKLRPFADGLLGRNELKLKLRRKARRLKLAQSVGNTVAMGEGSGADDGITTGWICCNLGLVDQAVIPKSGPGAVSSDSISKEQQEEMQSDEEEYDNPNDDYIGFGSRSQSPRIVVQMFTEEKRLEMDLEGLWDMRVSRRSRKAEKADATAEFNARARSQIDDEVDHSGSREGSDQSRPLAAIAGS